MRETKRQVRTNNNKANLCTSSLTDLTAAPGSTFRARQKYSLTAVYYPNPVQHFSRERIEPFLHKTTISQSVLAAH